MHPEDEYVDRRAGKFLMQSNTRWLSLTRFIKIRDESIDVFGFTKYQSTPMDEQDE